METRKVLICFVAAAVGSTLALGSAMAAEKAYQKRTTPAERQGFNPQPEPPGREAVSAKILGGAGWIIDNNGRKWRPAAPGEAQGIIVQGGKLYKEVGSEEVGIIVHNNKMYVPAEE